MYDEIQSRESFNLYKFINLKYMFFQLATVITLLSHVQDPFKVNKVHAKLLFSD